MCSNHNYELACRQTRRQAKPKLVELSVTLPDKSILSRANINIGIFGGYAITVLREVREHKDIDCIASVSKEQVIGIQGEKEGFCCSSSKPPGPCGLSRD